MPSKYQPQPPMWREDLYKGVYTTNTLLNNRNKLLYIDDSYCEFSRRIYVMTTGYKIFWLCVGIFFILGSLFFQFGYILSFISGKNLTFSLTVRFLSIIILIYIFSYHVILTLFFSPKDCPIRFNRKTGKVYVYEHAILYPFLYSLKSTFQNIKKVTIKEFDWIDIQAIIQYESSFFYRDPFFKSYRIECMVCKTGTSIVIDQFLLAFSKSLTYDEWMWINNYMAFSDKNLDTKLADITDYLGFQVKWPEDIDKKSKATSIDDYNAISTNLSI